MTEAEQMRQMISRIYTYERERRLEPVREALRAFNAELKARPLEPGEVRVFDLKPYL